MQYVAGRPVKSHRRASGFPGAHIAVLFFVLMLLVSVPIWTHPVPPLSDYVNHLARMFIIARIGTNATLAQYYQIEWQIIPNLVMDLIVPLLGRIMNIYLAGQIFTVAAFVLIASGVMALNRALFGRWTAVPLIAMPLLYNYLFLVGVMNYIFGIGLTLWALAGWIWLRDRAWPFRLILATLFVVALFFCHLFAVGLFGLGLLAFEIWRFALTPEKPVKWRLIEFVSSGVAFLPVVPLLLASPTMSLAREISWEPRGKLDGLVYVIELYSDIVAFALTATLAAAATWAARRGLLRVHPFGWVLLVIGAIIYLGLPRIMFATYMADQRLPVALAFMLIGCIDVSLQHRLVRRGFIAVLLTLVIVRVIEVNVSWANLSTTTAEFRSSVKRIKPGSKVLVAYGTSSAGDDVSDLGLVHAACLAIIERSALVTTAFTVVGKQILRVRPAYQDLVDTNDGTPPSIEKLLLTATRPQGDDEDEDSYWNLWPRRYDYLYVLFTDDEADNPAPQYLTLVQSGTRFQLYRITAPS
ncbi:MAG TPA: hypothetical protein VG966_04320 [Hyphomicrobiaceae bacterium]|nr:hypothetical protein [Hyphomicrobiaceae bacterium]